LRYYVFDIDNCVADDMHRRPLLAEGYDAYHSKHIDDDYHHSDVLSAARASGAAIIWLTGRTVKYRSSTEMWLHQKGLWGISDELLMRKNDDFRKSSEFKVAVLGRHLSMNGVPHSDIIMCYDDRAEVVEAYRAAGYKAEVLAIHGPEHFVTPAKPKRVRTPDAILEDMAAVFRERNKTYGDNYKAFGPLMAALFPHGIEPAQLHSNEFGAFLMIAVKMSRLATGGLNHADSAHDIGVYAAMLESLILENS
jgi:Domain of unknown function (DUF6378)